MVRRLVAAVVVAAAFGSTPAPTEVGLAGRTTGSAQLPAAGRSALHLGRAANCARDSRRWLNPYDRHRGRLRERVSFGHWTARLTGHPARDYGWRHVRLTVRDHGRRVASRGLPGGHPSGTARSYGSAPANLRPGHGIGAVCIGRFRGGGHAIVVGFNMGMQCCDEVAVIPLTAAGVGTTSYRFEQALGVTVATMRGRARLATADWFGCTRFWACAGGGAPIVVQDVVGSDLVRVTAHHPHRVERDARRWRSFVRRAQRHHPVEAFGVLAAWVADECTLGRESAAWRAVDRMRRDGRLRGNRYEPGGRRLVSFLHRFLRHEGFCTT